MNYRILDNLDSLENLVRNDFLELSNNIEEYYNYSNFQGNLVKLSQLFKIIAYEDFPSKFKLNNIKAVIVDGETRVGNTFNQSCYEEDRRLYITPILTENTAEKYKSISSKIRKTLPDTDKWKQKLYSVEKYNNYNNYSFEECCTVSINDDEIVNIFNNAYDIKDIDIILSAIELGGKKIKCYSDDFKKYTYSGFMPVSACKWDDYLAPKMWLHLNDMLDKDGQPIKEKMNNYNIELDFPRQDIIFFIYTGTNTDITYREWLYKNGYSEDYNQAKLEWNRVYKELKTMGGI